MDQDQTLFRDTVQEVNSWIPSNDPETQEEYRKELQEFLKTRLNNSKKAVLHQKSYSFTKKDETVDFTINNTVGVEVVADASDRIVKNLEDDIKKYSAKGSYMIVVACGLKDKKDWIDLKNKYQGTRELDRGQVQLIWKEEEFFGKEVDRNTGDSSFAEELI